MRRLTLEGVPPSNAAQLALSDAPGRDQPLATVTSLPTNDDLDSLIDTLDSLEDQVDDDALGRLADQQISHAVPRRDQSAPEARLADPAGWDRMLATALARGLGIPSARTGASVEDVDRLELVEHVGEVDPGTRSAEPLRLTSPLECAAAVGLSQPQDLLDSLELLAGQAAERSRALRIEPPGPAGWNPAGLRPGGGRVVALPEGSPQARGLARAAMTLDTHEINRLLRESVRSVGVVPTWETLALPVLIAIGDRWRSTGDGVDVEHAFSEVLLGVLRSVCATLTRPRNTCPVLLTCAEGDRHTLPLHVLAAALAEEEVGSRMMGAGMPPKDLVSCVRRSGPAVVFLFARLPVTDSSVLEVLPRQRPAPRVIVGGPGWDHAPLPGNVLRVSSLAAAVDEVLAAAQM